MEFMHIALVLEALISPTCLAYLSVLIACCRGWLGGEQDHLQNQFLKVKRTGSIECPWICSLLC